MISKCACRNKCRFAPSRFQMTAGIFFISKFFFLSCLLDAGSVLKVIALQRGNLAAAEEVTLEELQVFKVRWKGNVCKLMGVIQSEHSCNVMTALTWELGSAILTCAGVGRLACLHCIHYKFGAAAALTPGQGKPFSLFPTATPVGLPGSVPSILVAQIWAALDCRRLLGKGAWIWHKFWVPSPTPAPLSTLQPMAWLHPNHLLSTSSPHTPVPCIDWAWSVQHTCSQSLLFHWNIFKCTSMATHSFYSG